MTWIVVMAYVVVAIVVGRFAARVLWEEEHKRFGVEDPVLQRIALAEGLMIGLAWPVALALFAVSFPIECLWKWIKKSVFH